MKKILKIVFIFIGVVVVSIALGIAYLFGQLIDRSGIGVNTQSTSHSRFEVPKVDTVQGNSQDIKSVPPNSATHISAESKAAEQANVDEIEQKRLAKNKLTADLLDDLISTDIPMSDFCSSLPRANDEVFVNKKSFRNTLKKSILPNEADPRIQSVKPILRYVLRLPEVKNVMRIAQLAWERNDKSSLKTFDFFQKALVAFSEVNDHREEIHAVMDRSYLLFNLNKIGAKNPELLKDPRIHTYCEKIELAFNQSRPVSFEEEKKDFLNFMNDVGVAPDQINFDINYKTNLKLGINRKTVTMEGGWVQSLILPDGKNF